MNEETEITTTFIDTDPTYNDELQAIISQLSDISEQQLHTAELIEAASSSSSESDFISLWICGLLGLICAVLFVIVLKMR